MVKTPSTMLPLGTQAPEFTLPDLSGPLISLGNFADSPGLLVAFWCSHCPFVRHIRAAFARFATGAQERGLAVVAINANDIEAHPDDAPEKMAEEARDVGYTFPYLFDASQEVAKAYRAACTPDFFLFDGARRLVYRGQFDASRPGNDIPVTGEDLEAAVEALLSGREIPAGQKPSLGCNIKWKPGNEPGYFGGEGTRNVT